MPTVSPNQVLTMRILWGGLVMSTLAFVAVGYVSESQRTEPLTPEYMLLPVLAVVSVSVAAISVLFPKHLLSTSFRAAKYEVVEIAEKDRRFADKPQRARRFANPEAVRKSLAPKVQTPFIIGMALAESVALNGLVLWFLGFPLSQTLGFFVVCWVLMAAQFPNPARYEKALEKLYDADLV